MCGINSAYVSMDAWHPYLFEASVPVALLPGQRAKERSLFVYRQNVNCMFHVSGESLSNKLKPLFYHFRSIIAAIDSIKYTHKFDLSVPDGNILVEVRHRPSHQICI